jgi:hypothetical protein
MTAGLAADITRQTTSVGLLIDRCLKSETAIGGVCLVDANRVATCAHLVLPYLDFLPALKVQFPLSGESFGISSVVFHPDFDRRAGHDLFQRSLREEVPGLPLQRFNLALLTLAPENALDGNILQAVNEKMTRQLPVSEQGLTGKLDELDLASVIQTLTNARRKGTLVICDQRNTSQARLFCREGKVSHTNFAHLSGEKAFYQIFSQHLSGNFSFQSQEAPSWAVGESIARPTDMLLIESHRRMDEIPEMLLELGGEEAVFGRAAGNLDNDKLPEEVRGDALLVFKALDGSLPVGLLWRLVDLDDYSIFKVLVALLKSGQITSLPAAQPQSNLARRPLELGPHLPLSPWDRIQSVAVDAGTGMLTVKEGSLLGVLMRNDPWHVLHNISLPGGAAGSPILKDGLMVGMHCGLLPLDSSTHAIKQEMQQMLWVETIYKLLEADHAPANAQSDRSAQAGGCTELARIECPKCGMTSLDSARYCKSCGQSLVKGLEYKHKGMHPVLLVLAMLVLAVPAAFFALSLLHGQAPGSVSHTPGSASNTTTATATATPVNPATGSVASVSESVEDSAVDTTVQRADRNIGKFVPLESGTGIRDDDLIRVQIRVLRTTYVYVLYRGSSGKKVQMMYPESSAADERLLGQSVVTLPPEQHAHELNGFTFAGAPGTDTLIILSSPVQLSLPTDPASLAGAFDIADTILSKQPPKGREAVTIAAGKLTGHADDQGQVSASFVKLSHGSR